MLTYLTQAQLANYCATREGETRLGQAIRLPLTSLSLEQNLLHYKNEGVQFVLLGIPEDIGPRANFGQAGSDKAWQAFLTKFLNLQHNRFVKASAFLVLGEIHCSDLQEKASLLNTKNNEELHALRQLVSVLDERVYQVAKAIFDAGLQPIVIGGGHNNSYPLIKALSLSANQAVNCANLDPHSDFRPLEGRHSGNGFSYASHENFLKHYFVMGLHELKNSEKTLANLHKASAEFITYQQLFVRQELDYQSALMTCKNKVLQDNLPIGIEVDTDSISMMPVSAFTNCGISVQNAEQFVYQMAILPQSSYLHLAEAAPIQHPAGLNAGLNEAGQVLSALVLAYSQAKK